MGIYRLVLMRQTKWRKNHGDWSSGSLKNDEKPPKKRMLFLKRCSYLKNYKSNVHVMGIYQCVLKKRTKWRKNNGDRSSGFLKNDEKPPKKMLFLPVRHFFYIMQCSYIPDMGIYRLVLMRQTKWRKNHGDWSSGSLKNDEKPPNKRMLCLKRCSYLKNYKSSVHVMGIYRCFLKRRTKWRKNHGDRSSGFLKNDEKPPKKMLFLPVRHFFYIMQCSYIPDMGIYRLVLMRQTKWRKNHGD
jgi:hypothetical protein